MFRFALLAALFAVLLTTAVASAQSSTATLSVDPASKTVDPGEQFTVDVVQDSSGDTSGAQTNFEFDHDLLEVVDVVAGSGYPGASFLLGVAPQTKAQAIAEANSTGILKNVTTFYIPGAGSVPAGQAVFITITLKAKQVGGTSDLKLTLSEVLDTTGGGVDVTTNDGEVTVAGATPTPTQPGQTPTPTPTPTPSPTPSPTSCSVCVVTPTPTPQMVGEMRVSPASQAIPPGGLFAINLEYTSTVITTGGQATVTFDKNLVELVDVGKGTAFTKGALTFGIVPSESGSTPLPKANSIAQANSTGIVPKIAAFFIPGTGEVPAGTSQFAVLTFRAKSGTQGTSTLTLTDPEVLDKTGLSVAVTVKNGDVEVKTGATGGITPKVLPAAGAYPTDNSDGDLPMKQLVAGVAALFTGSAAAYVSTRRKRTETP